MVKSLLSDKHTPGGFLAKDAKSDIHWVSGKRVNVKPDMVSFIRVSLVFASGIMDVESRSLTIDFGASDWKMGKDRANGKD
jgi:hypothetical protein